MSNEEIVPVRHTTMSAFGTKATETVGGGFMGAIRGALKGTAWGALIGGALVFGVATGIGALISGISALTFSGVVLGGFTALGVIVGGFAGLISGTGIGGLFGAGRGFQEGRQRVNMERGAAQMMDMDFANAQMQLIAAAQQPRPAGTPATGSRYNQAAPTVDAGSIARDGMLAGQPQLQRA